MKESEDFMHDDGNPAGDSYVSLPGLIIHQIITWIK
jgi:hypothetical protein